PFTRPALQPTSWPGTPSAPPTTAIVVPFDIKVILLCRAGSMCDDGGCPQSHGVGQRGKPFDFHSYDVAVFQLLTLRLSDTCGCAGRDDVTRLEGPGATRGGDEPFDTDDEIGGGAVRQPRRPPVNRRPQHGEG